MREGAEVEREAADGDGGGALGHAADVGDGHLLGAEAFNGADLPLLPDDDAGCRDLGDDVSGGDGGGVEAADGDEVEAARGEAVLRVIGGEGDDGGDFDLGAVDGEAHGGEGEGQGDGEHQEAAEGEVEGAGHGWDQCSSEPVEGRVRPPRGGKFFDR